MWDIEKSQEYAGKKIQRLYRFMPNICAFYALGWMMFAQLVEIRKLLFIRSILDEGNENKMMIKKLCVMSHAFDSKNEMENMSVK